MSAFIPESVRHSALDDTLKKSGLTKIHQGKVRDTYSLPRKGLRLIVASDRVSVFDHVLPFTIPSKGEVLTAMTIFWLNSILREEPHHLLMNGQNIDHLPEGLRGNTELHGRALIVQDLKILPIECIVRGYLTGSGWSSYQKTGRLSKCSVDLPENLHDGSRIKPVFNPTTKEEVGHDEPIDDLEVVETYGKEIRERSLHYYERISEAAEQKGFIFADTKFEFGEGLILADEVGTPDSSRFWDKEEWEIAVDEKKSPSSYDKEIVRKWAKTVKTPFSSKPGIQVLSPTNPDHQKFVVDLEAPSEVIEKTADRYATVMKRLLGFSLDQYRASLMG